MNIRFQSLSLAPLFKVCFMYFKNISYMFRYNTIEVIIIPTASNPSRVSCYCSHLIMWPHILTAGHNWPRTSAAVLLKPVLGFPFPNSCSHPVTECRNTKAAGCWEMEGSLIRWLLAQGPCWNSLNVHKTAVVCAFPPAHSSLSSTEVSMKCSDSSKSLPSFPLPFLSCKFSPLNLLCIYI